MWLSISTLIQNRANVMSSWRRKISSMSCEVCGSVRKHDPTHTYTLSSVWRQLLLPAVEGFTENYSGGSKRQNERVRDTLDPGLNLTQMEDFSFTWPDVTSNTHTHTQVPFSGWAPSLFTAAMLWILMPRGYSEPLLNLSSTMMICRNLGNSSKMLCVSKYRQTKTLVHAFNWHNVNYFRTKYNILYEGHWDLAGSCKVGCDIVG